MQTKYKDFNKKKSLNNIGTPFVKENRSYK